MSNHSRAVQAEIALDQGESDIDSPFAYDPHVYDGERCINCNVNTYDDMIHGPFPCVPHEPVNYTTESPQHEHQ